MNGIVFPQRQRVIVTTSGMGLLGVGSLPARGSPGKGSELGRVAVLSGAFGADGDSLITSAADPSGPPRGRPVRDDLADPGPEACRATGRRRRQSSRPPAAQHPTHPVSPASHRRRGSDGSRFTLADSSPPGTDTETSPSVADPVTGRRVEASPVIDPGAGSQAEASLPGDTGAGRRAAESQESIPARSGRKRGRPRLIPVATVRAIVLLVRGGESLQGVANLLNAAGVPTPADTHRPAGERTGRWSKYTVRNVLTTQHGRRLAAFLGRVMR